MNKYVSSEAKLETYGQHVAAGWMSRSFLQKYLTGTAGMVLVSNGDGTRSWRKPIQKVSATVNMSTKKRLASR